MMTKQWWHNKTAYQIYPKSFCDSNGDGIGDLPGIISKLDYLKGLGIDIIWLSPVFTSPMVDNGYDVADYYGIDPIFGTMEDMDRLLAETKKKGMYLILDLVVNHCSDKHEWFQKALKDPYGKYGKYFYFKEGRQEIQDGKSVSFPPTNWRSIFGGSAWELVPGCDNLYYLHTFAREQVDLNWENRELREEIYTMVNWWLDKGLAGFRIDAITNIKKDLTWSDLEPDGPDGLGSIGKSMERVEGIGVFLEELRDRCFKPHNAFTVGEASRITSREKIEEFIGENGYFSSIFAFEPVKGHYHSNLWNENDRTMSLKEWKRRTFENQAQTADVAFECNIIENHDLPRGASLFIAEEDYGFHSVSALAALFTLLRGMPFLYQGQEIGMTNCPFEMEEFDDLGTHDQYRFMLANGVSPEDAHDACQRESRDNCRTPMQWDDSPNAGFTEGSPWLKCNPNYPTLNVQAQENEYGSILRFYRRLLAFRKSKEYGRLFTYGRFEPAYEDEEQIFAYKRILPDSQAAVICNFSPTPSALPQTAEDTPFEEVIFVNYPQATRTGNVLNLKPYELVVLRKS